MPIEPSASRPRAGLVAFVLAVAAVLAPGCERDAPPETYRQVVELKDLPDVVSGAARKALPDVTFQDSFKNLSTKDHALHSYEIRGRNARGKIREVRVSTDGKVLELE